MAVMEMQTAKDKALIHNLYGKYYGNKKKKEDPMVKAIKAKQEAIKVKTGASRNNLMLQVKEKGVKNFRILNKNELMHILAEGITQQEIDALVAGAVAKWKAGWGTRGKQTATQKA